MGVSFREKHSRGKKQKSVQKETVRKKIMKQESLEGMEQVTISELTELAERYEAKRDARLKLLGQEIELKDELMEMMKSYQLEVYRDGDLTVKRTYEEGIKCSREKPKAEKKSKKGES
jgi:hypothetical protein